MRKIKAKITRIRTTRWNKLTLGEKILSIVGTLVKWALILAVILTVASTIFAVIFSIAVAYGIGMAISGGFADASRAYRPGEHYVRFR